MKRVSILLLLAAVNTHVAMGQPFADYLGRRLDTAQAMRSYDGCKHAAHVRELKNQAAQRRLAKVNELRAALQRRRRLNAADVLATSHKASMSFELNGSMVDPKKLFGSTPKCILQPDVTQGAYYVKGELIRSDLRDSQQGIDLYTEIQVIDTATCTPVENLFLDVWHCNATGMYSGGEEGSPLHTTFGRGLQPTSADGVVHFTTKFPGHYKGRATHIHVVGNYNGTVLPNHTYVGSNVVNVGQLFFDQHLVDAVEATPPYASNEAISTINCVDRIFQQSTDRGFDPVVNYVFLGDTVSDGVFSWITIGVDMRATKAAATSTGDGGVPSAQNQTGPTNDGRGHEGVPKAPGPTVDETPVPKTDERNSTLRTALGEEEVQPRSAVFSVLFLVASASALAAILYKLPTKQNPRKTYEPMTSP